MLRNSVEALKGHKKYLQALVDDIESFLWVMVYAIVWNSERGGANDQEPRNHYNQHRDLALMRLEPFKHLKRCSQLTLDLSKYRFFRNCDEKVSHLAAMWQEECETLEAESKDSQTWTLCYAASAVSGLHVILDVAVNFLSRNT